MIPVHLEGVIHPRSKEHAMSKRNRNGLKKNQQSKVAAIRDYA